MQVSNNLTEGTPNGECRVSMNHESEIMDHALASAIRAAPGSRAASLLFIGVVAYVVAPLVLPFRLSGAWAKGAKRQNAR